MTGSYLEFYTGNEKHLQIRPGGMDFFRDIETKLLRDVCEDDLENVRKATGKTSLMRRVWQEEALFLTFKKKADGKPEPYSLQTIKTRGSDDYHIVIGIKPE